MKWMKVRAGNPSLAPSTIFGKDFDVSSSPHWYRNWDNYFTKPLEKQEGDFLCPVTSGEIIGCVKQNGEENTSGGLNGFDCVKVDGTSTAGTSDCDDCPENLLAVFADESVTVCREECRIRAGCVIYASKTATAASGACYLGKYFAKAVGADWVTGSMDGRCRIGPPERETHTGPYGIYADAVAGTWRPFEKQKRDSTDLEKEVWDSFGAPPSSNSRGEYQFTAFAGAYGFTVSDDDGGPAPLYNSAGGVCRLLQCTAYSIHTDSRVPPLNSVWETIENACQSRTTVEESRICRRPACVFLYEGENFDGTTVELHSDTDQGWSGGWWGVGHYNFGSTTYPGDQLSSLRVEAGCTAQVWEHILPRGLGEGWQVTLGPGSYNKAALLAAGAKDNEASAVKVARTCVKIYEGRNFTGWVHELSAGVYQAMALGGANTEAWNQFWAALGTDSGMTAALLSRGSWNDMIRSLEVMPGCHAGLHKSLLGYRRAIGWHIYLGPGSYDSAALEAIRGSTRLEFSSIKVTQVPSTDWVCAKLYEGSNFNGIWTREFSPGSYRVRNTGSDFPNNELSSMEVMVGCHVVVYTNRQWNGVATSFGPGRYDPTAFLAAGVTGNGVSSIRVTRTPECNSVSGPDVAVGYGYGGCLNCQTGEISQGGVAPVASHCQKLCDNTVSYPALPWDTTSPWARKCGSTSVFMEGAWAIDCKDCGNAINNQTCQVDGGRINLKPFKYGQHCRARCDEHYLPTTGYWTDPWAPTKKNFWRKLEGHALRSTEGVCHGPGRSAVHIDKERSGIDLVQGGTPIPIEYGGTTSTTDEMKDRFVCLQCHQDKNCEFWVRDDSTYWLRRHDGSSLDWVSGPGNSTVGKRGSGKGICHYAVQGRLRKNVQLLAGTEVMETLGYVSGGVTISTNDWEEATKIACMHCGEHPDCESWEVGFVDSTATNLASGTATYYLKTGGVGSWERGSFYAGDKYIDSPVVGDREIEIEVHSATASNEQQVIVNSTSTPEISPIGLDEMITECQAFCDNNYLCSSIDLYEGDSSCSDKRCPGYGRCRLFYEEPQNFQPSPTFTARSDGSNWQTYFGGMKTSICRIEGEELKFSIKALADDGLVSAADLLDIQTSGNGCVKAWCTAKRTLLEGHNTRWKFPSRCVPANTTYDGQVPIRYNQIPAAPPNVGLTSCVVYPVDDAASPEASTLGITGLFARSECQEGFTTISDPLADNLCAGDPNSAPNACGPSNFYEKGRGNHDTVSCYTNGQLLTPPDGNLIPEKNYDDGGYEPAPAHCDPNVCTTDRGILNAMWDEEPETSFVDTAGNVVNDTSARKQRCRMIATLENPYPQCRFTCDVGYHEVPSIQDDPEHATKTKPCPYQNYTWKLDVATEWASALHENTTAVPDGNVVNRCDGNVCHFTWPKLFVSYNWHPNWGSCSYVPWRVARADEYIGQGPSWGAPAQLWYNRESCNNSLSEPRTKLGRSVFASDGEHYNEFPQHPQGPEVAPKWDVIASVYFEEVGGNTIKGELKDIHIILTNPTRDGFFRDGAVKPKGVEERLSAPLEVKAGGGLGMLTISAGEASDLLSYMEGYQWASVPQANCHNVVHPDTCSASCAPGYTNIGGGTGTTSVLWEPQAPSRMGRTLAHDIRRTRSTNPCETLRYCSRGTN